MSENGEFEYWMICYILISMLIYQYQSLIELLIILFELCNLHITNFYHTNWNLCTADCY
jgi:hypothetical protein